MKQSLSLVLLLSLLSISFVGCGNNANTMWGLALLASGGSSTNRTCQQGVNINACTTQLKGHQTWSTVRTSTDTQTQKSTQIENVYEFFEQDGKRYMRRSLLVNKDGQQQGSFFEAEILEISTNRIKYKVVNHSCESKHMESVEDQLYYRRKGQSLKLSDFPIIQTQNRATAQGFGEAIAIGIGEAVNEMMVALVTAPIQGLASVLNNRSEANLLYNEYNVYPSQQNLVASKAVAWSCFVEENKKSSKDGAVKP